MSNIIKETYDLEERQVEISQFKQADYYVVSYWQKFLGGTKGYKENISWMEDLISDTKSKYKFTYIKINTDLQENWGLEPGKKAKLKVKRTKNEMTIEIDDFPVKK